MRNPVAPIFPRKTCGESISYRPGGLPAVCLYPEFPLFLPFLQERFPRLVQRYREWYTRNTYAPEEYRKKIAERVARLRVKHGFNVRPWDEMKRPVGQVKQLLLELAVS